MVPQQVIDEIQQSAFLARTSGRASAYLGKEAEGKYTRTEMPDSYLIQRREYLNSVLSLAESFEIVAAYGLLDSDDFETLVEVLTPAAVGAVYASDSQSMDGLVLLSDDLGLSNFARSLGKNAVNTQAVIWELYRSNLITGESYSSLIEQLLLLNYWFVRVNADDILRRLEANGFLTTPGVHAMLKTLEGPDCSEDSAVLVGTALGPVDILPKPDESASEVEEAQVPGVQFLKPGEYPAKLLHLVDETLHQMPFPVYLGVIFLRFLPVGTGRYNRDHALLQNGSTQRLGVVPFVRNHILAPVTGDQIMGLGNVMLLSSGQQEPQGIPQSVHAHVDLGAETTPAPAQGLGFLPPLPEGAPAAQGWAGTTVLSMMRCSRSGSPAKWRCIRSQMPWSAQRENRLYTLFQLP